MKALTTRRPISLTTTSLCSGTFAARIARSQRLHVLRIAGFAMAGWERLDRDVNAGFFKAYGLDVQAMTLSGAEEAVAALSDGIADVAFMDTLTAVRAHIENVAIQFIAIRDGMDFGYVGLRRRSMRSTMRSRASRERCAKMPTRAMSTPAIFNWPSIDLRMRNSSTNRLPCKNRLAVSP